MDLVQFNKRLLSFALVTAITGLSFGALGTVYDNKVYAASVAYNQASSKISQLETSLEKNYLGSSNLPTFRKYLAEAKTLISKVTSASEASSLNERWKQCESIIVTTECIVNMEASMDKNYRGMKNVPAFEAYIEKVNAALAGVKNKIIFNKISERSYAGSNVVRDIKVADSAEYKAADALLKEAIALVNEGKTSEAKAKATEGLDYVWKCTTSMLKDSIAGELKAIRDM